MAENGYHLVWGGTDTGLMKVIASGVKEGGGKLVGISLAVFEHLVRKDADEMIIAKSLGERKAAMLGKGDAVVGLVGGLGTLDELTDIIELKRQKHHSKPIVILNTDNFYEGLIHQFQKMEREGFNLFKMDDYVKFVDTPEEAIAILNQELK